MPRPMREDHEGAWHHVMNRGIDHGPVFHADDDRQIFLECLAAAADRYGLHVHAYCLMGNHFHLLVLSEKGRLSDGMRFLAARFTQRINYRDDRDGPIFRGRFASVMIKDDAHLVRASRYIHRNPVEAGLVITPENWAWSSAAAYLGVRRAPNWLRTTTILDLFGAAAQSEYRAFLQQEVDEATRASYDAWKAEPSKGGQTRRV
jgi:REP element-mobilizing transposase RayT